MNAREPFIGPLLESTRMLPLTQGQYSLVDENGYEDLNQDNWYARWDKDTKSFYAGRTTRREDGKRYTELLHQRVTGFQWKKVDHINHNTLDNRKSNLRDGKHNNRNRTPQSGLSQYYGVYWLFSNSKWVARIGVDGKHIYLGSFDDEMAAAQVYDDASLLYHKEYGIRNFT